MIEHIRQIFFSPTHLVMGARIELSKQHEENPTARLQKIAFENHTPAAF